MSIKKIVFVPAVNNLTELSDIVSRSAWHLSMLDEFEIVIYARSENLSLTDVVVPDSFSDEISKKLELFFNQASVVISEKPYSEEMIDDATAILKWKENDSELNNFLKSNCSCSIYRVDSEVVRQEGSFYIQCAFDLLSNKESLIDDSRNKFNMLFDKLGLYPESWVLATGPSVEHYKDHDFSSSLTIACNSTILDNDLMEICHPKIVVFADPIFHFGVSQYAEEFRRSVRNRFETTDITVILPFKYYALFLSIFPEYADRIIGVPLEKDMDFNSDIQNDFRVKSTANILTLLLLPVASTFSDSINILGCDGRSFDDDDYFWGHGKTVQINSKMTNIQDVHPGFFKIDYNEYYFEHCHTLDVLMTKGELENKVYTHHANSFIPAFRDRNEQFKVQKDLKEKHVILIEPDGVGVNGHYVPWYNQLIRELGKQTDNVQVFINLKQNPELYLASAKKIFTSHSWGISRGDWCFKKGFEKHSSFIKFFDELESGILEYCNNKKNQEITIFMYYGSVQILSGFHHLKKKLKTQNINISLSICLFHESVILDSKVKFPRLPPNARTILMEGLAQSDSYNIASVTKSLQNFIYDKTETLTHVMPNPIPNAATTKESLAIRGGDTDDGPYKVVFPCALREEKGGELVKCFIRDVASLAIDTKGFVFFVRTFDDVDCSNVNNVFFIENNISDEEYNSLLSTADAIVIPYLSPQFTYRTSGIIVDSMKFKKPIVVINDTWLGDVVKEYKAGISIKYYSSNSFLSSFKVFKDNKKTLNKYSSISFDNYQVSNSWEALCKIMFL
ncbi:hypothetical protein [Amphritea sp.]|uniref:hypothetical protein n=1 Tax=Amphritea sp. TaxID=1872502 RepID=UPI003A95C9DE